MKSRLSRLRLEPLESRLVPAFVADGPEFAVRSTATRSYQLVPAVAADAAGDHVIAWSDDDRVRAQRYDRDGRPVGPEAAVAGTSVGGIPPGVAMDADGDSVLVWMRGDGPSDDNVYGRRFDRSGAPVGDEFLVTSYPARQWYPSVAMDADGDFVVVWFEPYRGLVAQRYDAAGRPAGAEISVDSDGPRSNGSLSVAMDAAGDFAVAWASFDADGSGTGVVARLFSADGVAAGDPFQVNTHTDSDQADPSVGMDADGDLVVSWWSLLQDGSAGGIYARRYDRLGAAVGGEFPVNTTALGWQDKPSMAMAPGGDFLIAWTSFGQDGDAGGVYARRFGADGHALGDEFCVNTTTADSQSYPAAALDARGDAVIAWTSYKIDEESLGVFAQRYVTNPRPTTSGLPPVTVAEDGGPITLSLPDSFRDEQFAPQALGYGLVSADGTPGLFRVATVDAAGRLTLEPAANASGSATVTVRATDPPSGLSTYASFTVTVTPVNDAPTVVLPTPPAYLVDQSLPVPGVSVADVESGTVRVTLSVGGGTLSLGGAAADRAAA